MPRIAIIEDEPAVNNQYRSWLLAHDPKFQIDQFLTHHEAVQAIEKQKYDLILLDIELDKDQKAGVNLMIHVARNQSCPVVAISGLDAEEHEETMRALEAFDYMQKPAAQKPFISVVCAALRKNGLRRPNDLIDEAEMPDGLVIKLDEMKYPTWHGDRLVLPITAQRMLRHLAIHANTPVTFADLRDYAPYADNDRIVKYHVYKINAAFRAVDPEFNKIKNIPIVGYQWFD